MSSGAVLSNSHVQLLAKRVTPHRHDEFSRCKEVLAFDEVQVPELTDDNVEAWCVAIRHEWYGLFALWLKALCFRLTPPPREEVELFVFQTTERLKRVPAVLSHLQKTLDDAKASGALEVQVLQERLDQIKSYVKSIKLRLDLARLLLKTGFDAVYEQLLTTADAPVVPLGMCWSSCETPITATGCVRYALIWLTVHSAFWRFELGRERGPYVRAMDYHLGVSDELRRAVEAYCNVARVQSASDESHETRLCVQHLNQIEHELNSLSVIDQQMLSVVPPKSDEPRIGIKGLNRERDDRAKECNESVKQSVADIHARAAKLLGGFESALQETPPDSHDVEEIGLATVLLKLRAPTLSEDDQCEMIWAAELLPVPDEFQAALLNQWSDYIDCYRSSQKPNVLQAVACAVRKYVAVLPAAELSRVAVLLEPTENGSPCLPPEIELAVAKMAVRKLIANPPAQENSEPELATRLYELAKNYLRDFLVARDHFGPTALNALLAVALLRSPHIEELLSVVDGLKTVWFVELLRSRAERLIAELPSHASAASRIAAVDALRRVACVAASDSCESVAT